MNESHHPDEIQLDVEQVSKELRIRPEIYMRILASFAKSLDQKIKNLNDALCQNDRDQMRMLLHEIKGTASNLRLQNILAPEEAMHIAVTGGQNTASISQHFENLRVEAEKLQQYVYKLSNQG